MAAAGSNLGFLTVLNDASGFLGGYLVTNQWGRPLEFRLSTAVQPNRVQQILYGDTLEPFVCADLIGKTLVDKTATPANVVITNRPAALELRWRVDVPVGLLPAAQGSASEVVGTLRVPSRHTECAYFPLQVHPQFPQDEAAVRQLLDSLSGLDLAEPFTRIREAIAEARKLGVTSRG